MNASELRDHMERDHESYPHIGKAISIEDYRKIIHDLDHDDRLPTEGIKNPHTHEQKGET